MEKEIDEAVVVVSPWGGKWVVLASHAHYLCQHSGPHALKSPVLCLMLCVCRLEILDIFAFVNKVQWNWGASARGLEPRLTHSLVFSTSLGQALRHLLPSRLMPQAPPGLLLTQSVPCAWDSSWVAGRRREGGEAQFVLSASTPKGARAQASWAQVRTPWGISGQAVVVAVLPWGWHCHGMSRQHNRGCSLVEMSLLYTLDPGT